MITTHRTPTRPAAADPSHRSVRLGGVGLTVAGDLDLEGSLTLRAAVQRELVAGCTVLVLDLSATTFLDAAGVGTLLGAQRRLRHAGGDLVLRRPSPAVDRVLVLLGVRDRFTLA